VAGRLLNHVFRRGVLREGLLYVVFFRRGVQRDSVGRRVKTPVLRPGVQRDSVAVKADILNRVCGLAVVVDGMVAAGFVAGLRPGL
jgi:hypothetical protein